MRPFLKWAGSKKWLVRKGVPSPSSGYYRYIEPFLGSGAVFFDTLPERALLSDSNAYLVNCFIQIRENWHGVHRAYQDLFSLHSEASYYKTRSELSAVGVIGAAQFLYLNRTCFNGVFRVNLSGRFNVPIGSKISNPFDKDDFEAWSVALASAEIRNDDFEQIIDRAGIGDFIFIDPPYTVAHNKNGFIEYNEKIFSWEDQVRLAESVRKAQMRGAQFALTNANHKSVRELYGDQFSVQEVDRRSAIAGNAGKRQMISEIIVTSFEPRFC